MLLIKNKKLSPSTSDPEAYFSASKKNISLWVTEGNKKTIKIIKIIKIMYLYFLLKFNLTKNKKIKKTEINKTPELKIESATAYNKYPRENKFHLIKAININNESINNTER